MLLLRSFAQQLHTFELKNTLHCNYMTDYKHIFKLYFLSWCFVICPHVNLIDEMECNVVKILVPSLMYLLFFFLRNIIYALDMLLISVSQKRVSSCINLPLLYNKDTKHIISRDLISSFCSTEIFSSYPWNRSGSYQLQLFTLSLLFSLVTEIDSKDIRAI